MTCEIPREEWKKFFDDLSKGLSDWETSVEVLGDDGAQLLSVGLPFGGLTFEDSAEHPKVELSLGSSHEPYQSHTIESPSMVAFENSGHGPGGVLDIEDGSGTKTLVRFIQPYPVPVKYVKAEMVSTG